MTSTFTDVQLDALRELANIGSGTAGTALSAMLGKPVDINVPKVAALPVPDAVEAVGDPSEPRWAVVVPTVGDLPGHVLLLFPQRDAVRLCELLGVPVDSEDGRSALGEIGNILGTSYINALAQMLGIDTEPAPPMVVCDMLGAILASVLLSGADADVALIMDSALVVEGEACELSFLLLPQGAAVGDLLGRLGL
ncbi:MAG TPA: chemotaxis protein CheC [Baekduia sp.]|nr:chemotaxis protein CheC [Baekduia sp.]